VPAPDNRILRLSEAGKLRAAQQTVTRIFTICGKQGENNPNQRYERSQLDRRTKGDTPTVINQSCPFWRVSEINGGRIINGQAPPSIQAAASFSSVFYRPTYKKKRIPQISAAQVSLWPAAAHPVQADPAPAERPFALVRKGD